MECILLWNQTEEKMLKMLWECIKLSLEEDKTIWNFLFLPHEYNIENTIESIKNGKAKYWFVSLENWKINGFMRIMQIFPNSERFQHHFSLKMLYVLPEKRKKWIALKLINEAMNFIILEFKNIDVFHFELDVQSENTKAIELYRKSGFKKSWEFEYAIKLDEKYISLSHFEKNIFR